MRLSTFSAPLRHDPEQIRLLVDSALSYAPKTAERLLA
jgi:RNA:NAD 2'-phosphotransferase (TPT1/KptA family)